jgi:hypothetical protein
LNFAVAPWWEDDVCAGRGDFVARRVGDVALVSNRGSGFETIDEIMGKGDVMRWPGEPIRRTDLPEMTSSSRDHGETAQE